MFRLSEAQTKKKKSVIRLDIDQGHAGRVRGVRLRSKDLGVGGLKIRADGVENVVLVGRGALLAEALGGEGGLGVLCANTESCIRPQGQSRLVSNVLDLPTANIRFS